MYFEARGVYLGSIYDNYKRGALFPNLVNPNHTHGRQGRGGSGCTCTVIVIIAIVSTVVGLASAVRYLRCLVASNEGVNTEIRVSRCGCHSNHDCQS